MAVTVKENGREDDDTFEQLRQAKLHPSKVSVWRWQRKLATEGSLTAYKMNGNQPATVLRGYQLLNFSTLQCTGCATQKLLLPR